VTELVVITEFQTSTSETTEMHFDENGKTMLGSVQVHEQEFSDRVVAETRALLATVPSIAE
jgi:hypothetical protein